MSVPEQSPEISSPQDGAPAITPQVNAPAPATPGVSESSPVQSSMVQKAAVDEVAVAAETPVTAPEPPAPVIPAPPVPQPVYVAGKLRVVFPDKGLEKECEAAAQEISSQTGKTVAPYDYGTIFGYQTDPSQQNGAYSSRKTKPYRYIAEQINWVLSVDEQDVYLVRPNSVVELNEFIDYLATVEQSDGQLPHLLCVLIGEQQGTAQSDNLDQSLLPVIHCRHIFAFNADPQTIKDKIDHTGENTTTTAITNLLELMETRKNLGNSDFLRAKNFLTFRYPEIYQIQSDASGSRLSSGSHSQGDAAFLLNIQIEYAPSTSNQTLVNVIFHYQKAVSGRLFSYYASVDVTGLFPYLNTPLTDYIPAQP
ncbi:hypothetical protein VA7868_00446 [Vibrio aerogenes CECT 7868]|uniref:PatG domain-containing protein n=1 Tax=Vibrio aerogenes CECT 7868 TaxID=1216006 RepID=A0A1M5VMI8_9VIBR|nr:hypothetical protein [Vibrio aerogenes]SHH76461.1 hypothetical protein VA7868_00446 [Vibrio aerogenes CECT 7868]